VVREPEACRADDATLPYTAIGDHTHLQWLLATIGRHLGYRVWIASNDWGKAHEGETLGSLSEPALPALGVNGQARRLVSLIDVLWLRGEGEVAAAFEVEHTTSVYSGLLRMADLASLSPNLRFPLYVVAPKERLDKVRRELSRPTLQALGLHRRSAFFSSEALEEAAPAILQWGSDISAIDRIASRLGGD
jgi:type II restriction enzyme